MLHCYDKLQGLNSDQEMWESTLSVNIASFAYMGQACYPHMKEIALQGENCAIVNTGSVGAHTVSVYQYRNLYFDVLCT